MADVIFGCRDICSSLVRLSGISYEARLDHSFATTQGRDVLDRPGTPYVVSDDWSLSSSVSEDLIFGFLESVL